MAQVDIFAVEAAALGVTGRVRLLLSLAADLAAVDQIHRLLVPQVRSTAEAAAQVDIPVRVAVAALELRAQTGLAAAADLPAAAI